MAKQHHRRKKQPHRYDPQPAPTSAKAFATLVSMLRHHPLLATLQRLWRTLFVHSHTPPLKPFCRRDVLGLGVLLFSAWCLYAASTPRTVMLEDDGLFITTAAHAGVAHAPGYPLYVLIGWLASHIPYGSIAWRVHSASGAMAALTCVLLAWLVLRRTGNRPAAYIAAAALALSEHFWSQAIIADVYTTNTAMLFLTLVLLQEALAKRQWRLWVAAAMVYGLGLGNHWPLLVLGSPLLLAYAASAGSDFWKRLPLLAVACLATAAVLYGWMVWRSHQPISISFTSPIESLDQFIRFVRRERYAGVDNSINADFHDKLLYARYFSTELLLQLSIGGALLALFGAVMVYRQQRLYLIGEAATLISSSYLLIGLLGFDYEYIRIALFRPYPLVAYCVFALWLGYGVHALMDCLHCHAGWRQALVCASSGLVIGGMGIWNSNANYRPGDTLAADQAYLIFDLIERNAVYVAYGDSALPMIYLHQIEGVRPDVRLLEYHGLVLADRIVQRGLSSAQGQKAWRQFIASTQRPVYYSIFNPQFPHSAVDDYGFVRKVNRERKGGVHYLPSERAQQAFREMSAYPSGKNLWAYFHINQMIYNYGYYLGKALTANNPARQAFAEALLPVAKTKAGALHGIIVALIQVGSKDSISTAADYMQIMKATFDTQPLTKVRHANALLIEGYLAARQHDTAKAITLYKQSIAINKAPNNQAHRFLQQIAPQ